MADASLLLAIATARAHIQSARDIYIEDTEIAKAIRRDLLDRAERILVDVFMDHSNYMRP